MRKYGPYYDNENTEWFREARFGMFIHWGLYAIPARGEWVRSTERITVGEYQKYFDAFDPYRYDPAKWARTAREAGMKYVVMTTKHHDGFCLFDTKYTDYKATNTKAKRDLIREYVDAFRAEGLKIGLYYSVIDWHHPDYPKFSDQNHPMRGNESFRDEQINFDNYVKYLHAQVEELATNYGKIDIFWFDFSYGEMRGEKWKSRELVRMLRRLQPEAIIDNRLGVYNDGETPTEEQLFCGGDFMSPEQIIPPDGLKDPSGEKYTWEACITLNDHWGYATEDRNYKSPETVIRMLVECVSKNGNLLLNVGPNARGELPEESEKLLAQVGHWMRNNSDSIYGCAAAALQKPEWGRFTQNGDRLFAHVFERGAGPMLCSLPDGKRAGLVTYLRDGAELMVSDAWPAPAGSLAFRFTHAALPDGADTVIEVELK